MMEVDGTMQLGHLRKNWLDGIKDMKSFSLFQEDVRFVCHQLCADHITHGQPVVCRVQFPNGVQDSTSATFAQEARTRQGADVQLPADIQPYNISKVIERLVLDRLRPHLRIVTILL